MEILLDGWGGNHDHYHVVDVGGGPGQYMAQLLEALGPYATGTLFDTYPDAGWYVRAAMADRVAIQSGDPTGDLPDGGDLYFLASVLHDLSDASALDLLKRCSNASAEGSAIVVMERHWDPRSLSDSARNLDMQILFGGRERTDTELSTLMVTSGFEIAHVVRTRGYRMLSGRRSSDNAR
jgi:hypothetical protein